jgi:hypothetical protein
VSGPSLVSRHGASHRGGECDGGSRRQAALLGPQIEGYRNWLLQRHRAYQRAPHRRGGPHSILSVRDYGSHAGSVLVRALALRTNPIDVDEWPFRTEKMDYVLWIGRGDSRAGAVVAAAGSQS